MRQKSDLKTFEACIKIIGYIAYAAEEGTTIIEHMFELGLSEILMDTLSMTDKNYILNKTLWAIANILKDSEESYRKICFENEG